VGSILATRLVQGAQPRLGATPSLLIIERVVRYASLFLVPYAILIIVGQSRLRRAFAAKRLAALGAGLLPGLAIQVYTIVSVFDGAPPGGVSSDLERLAVPAVGSVVVGVRAPAVIRAWESVPTLAGANAACSFAAGHAAILTASDTSAGAACNRHPDRIAMPLIVKCANVSSCSATSRRRGAAHGCCSFGRGCCRLRASATVGHEP
jgi:hypothetical protein